jgi:single-stranded-DNA-specific exonuclease
MLDAITPKFLNVLKQMAPFGPENPKPVFAAKNMFVYNSLSNFKERHIRFLAGQQGNESVFQAVAFDQAEHYNRLASGENFTLVFTVEENVYNGNTSIQLRVKDIKFE